MNWIIEILAMLGLLLGVLGGIALVRARNRAYLCPWGQCGWKLSRAPLVSSTETHKNYAVYVAEECDCCLRPVIWDGINRRYVRFHPKPETNYEIRHSVTLPLPAGAGTGDYTRTVITTLHTPDPVPEQGQ